MSGALRTPYSTHVAAILAPYVSGAADECPDETPSEAAIIDVALDLAHGELTEAFGAEAADRICEDDRTYELCAALLRFHWSTGGVL